MSVLPGHFKGCDLGLCWMLVLVFVFVSCFPDEQRTSEDEQALLTFSVDTVHFDTLFTGERSTSRRARVYNPSREAVRIRHIAFSKGSASPFFVWVEGVRGKRFEDVRILGEDSLLLLFELDLPAGSEPMPRVVDEGLYVNVGARDHILPLRVWAQDVLREEEEVVIRTDELWTGLPRIIGMGLRIEAGATLRLAAGMRLFFREGAFCEVKGRLLAEGTAEEPVTFTYVRQDELYRESVGQWKGISFVGGSSDNHLRHVELANAEIALQLSTPAETAEAMLRLTSCVLKHMSVGGILAYGSRVEATNVLIYDCGQYILRHQAGGDYRYRHVTFSNAITTVFRQEASFQFSDYAEAGEAMREGSLHLELRNSIFWGVFEEELVFDVRDAARLRVEAAANILHSMQTERFAEGDNVLSQTRNFPQFVDPLHRDYHLLESSPACGGGIWLEEVQVDLEDTPRENPPTIGAYGCSEEE